MANVKFIEVFGERGASKLDELSNYLGSAWSKTLYVYTDECIDIKGIKLPANMMTTISNVKDYELLRERVCDFINRLVGTPSTDEDADEAEIYVFMKDKPDEKCIPLYAPIGFMNAALAMGGGDNKVDDKAKAFLNSVGVESVPADSDMSSKESYDDKLFGCRSHIRELMARGYTHEYGSKCDLVLSLYQYVSIKIAKDANSNLDEITDERINTYAGQSLSRIQEHVNMLIVARRLITSEIYSSECENSVDRFIHDYATEVLICFNFADREGRLKPSFHFDGPTKLFL